MLPLFRLLLLLLLCLTPVWMATPAWAVQWQLTGQSADGLAQQYVDLDSVRGAGSLWTVNSYFLEQPESVKLPELTEQPELVERQNLTEKPVGAQLGQEGIASHRVDYVTKYDCDRQLYQDVAPDGRESDHWGDASADPLNQATMTYVCEHWSS